MEFTSTTVAPEDTAPDIDDSIPGAPALNVGDVEAPFGRTATGRIRKRPIGSRASGGGGRSPNQSNEKLAAQAAAALCQLNGLMAGGAFVLGMRRTAKTMSDNNDDFKEQAEAALVTDPKLCMYILKGGASGGKFALIIAYLMYGMSIVPDAREEVLELRARRASEAV